MSKVRKGDQVRAQILRYLSRQEKLTNQVAELQEIGEAIGLAIEDVSDQLDILDSMGAVRANRTLGGGAAPMITGAGKMRLEELEEKLREEEKRPFEGNQSPGTGFEWDAFISYASEDKEPFVKQLAEQLTSEGLPVWYDDFALTLGDSLRRSIDRGLSKSRYGIVVLSPPFFAKESPQK